MPSLTPEKPCVPVAGSSFLIILHEVLGYDDPWRDKPDCDQAMSMTNPIAPTIMICHQPELLPEVVQQRIDLTLAGFYHEGQVKLPFFGLAMSPAHIISEFVEGLYVWGGSFLAGYSWHRPYGADGAPHCLARNHPAPPGVIFAAAGVGG